MFVDITRFFCEQWKLGHSMQLLLIIQQNMLASRYFTRILDAAEVYFIQLVRFCPTDYLWKWLSRMQLSNMPLHIIFAWRTLCARDHRASILSPRASADSTLVSLGCHVPHKVFLKVFAVFESRLAVWTCVCLMPFEVLAITC
jgi:hypothetical protein